MGYKNPIPSLDDKFVSKRWGMCFTFPETVTKEEALRGIQELIEENNGKIPPAWLHMGEPHGIRFAEPQNTKGGG